MIVPGLLVFLASVAWVLVEGALTYRNGMLTATQMKFSHPAHTQGLPFIWHFGMWGDLFFISPILGVAVEKFGRGWSVSQMVLMLFIGTVLSGGMHWMYTQTSFPDSLAWKGGMSAAGWLHFLYMGIALAIIGLLYFCTERPAAGFLIAVSVLLAVHVAIGNHVLLGWINEYAHFPWCPEFLRKRDPWITVGAVCLILAVLTSTATGDWHNGAYFIVICAVIAIIPPGLQGLARVPH